jgi:hypothetical protein
MLISHDVNKAKFHSSINMQCDAMRGDIAFYIILYQICLAPLCFDNKNISTYSLKLPIFTILQNGKT